MTVLEMKFALRDVPDDYELGIATEDLGEEYVTYPIGSIRLHNKLPLAVIIPKNLLFDPSMN